MSGTFAVHAASSRCNLLRGIFSRNALLVTLSNPSNAVRGIADPIGRAALNAGMGNFIISSTKDTDRRAMQRTYKMKLRAQLCAVLQQSNLFTRYFRQYYIR